MPQPRRPQPMGPSRRDLRAKSHRRPRLADRKACSADKKMGGSTAKDISGQRFGSLVAIERSGTRIHPSGKKRALWLFACDCGGSTERIIYDVSKSLDAGCPECFRLRAAKRAKICPPPIQKRENVIGKRFGSLMVVSVSDKGKWECSCDCGGKTYRRLCDLRSNLKRSSRSSCDECRLRLPPKHSTKGYKLPRRTLSLIGKKFGALTVKSIAEYTPSGTYWYCDCECGSDIVSKRSSAQLRRVKNPGCKDCESDRRAVIHLTHGGAYKGVTRLYSIWKGMIGRCRNLKNPNYGAKGISVCQEWEDFGTFRRWARGAGYQEWLTIDRLNPSKGYFPRNCEWVTQEENSRRVFKPKMRAA